MEEDKDKEQNEQDLHPERYDESLFRRAYTAGLKLMELKEKEKRRKLIFQISGFLLTVIFIILGIYWYISNKPPVYTSPVVWEVEEGIILDDPLQPYIDVSDIELDITAKSTMVFNPDTGQIFFEKDISAQRLIASLTKLVSSMVIMDSMDLNEVITVGELPTYGEDELYGMGLEVGDQVTVEDLLKMMLVSSYNDAAIAASESIGGEEFISLMNEKASVLGLEHTHFTNPCGLDNEDNYSTAKDLYKTVRAFMNYPTLMKIVNNEDLNVEYIRDEETIVKEIPSTNYLMGRENVVGLKTGYTEDAGASVITLYQYENGSRLMIIVVDSEDRYTETETMETMITDLIHYQ